MGSLWTKDGLCDLLETLGETYDVFAPVCFKNDGCYSDTDTIRYGKIRSFEEIVWDQKSQYSFKEALLPPSETILHFTESTTKLPEPGKKPLIFLRACDLNALKRLDEIYLRNGPADYYYRERRQQAVFVLMGCSRSFSSCFCVSMGTNVTFDFDAYAHQYQDTLYMEFKNPQLADTVLPLTKPLQEQNQDIQYVTANEETVTLPTTLPKDIAQHSLWEDYKNRCIGCGRCNFVCPTCTCYTMQDIYYKENSRSGERRRVWSSCQVDGYTDMAGGISFRQDQGQRMRFKVLHKILNFKNRFSYHMCVGCGRCEEACPEYISYIGCLQKLSLLGGECNDQ